MVRSDLLKEQPHSLVFKRLAFILLFSKGAVAKRSKESELVDTSSPKPKYTLPPRQSFFSVSIKVTLLVQLLIKV